MERRRRSSTADGLMDLVALLPWWGGVALAAVSYWVLHAVATRPLPTVQTGKQLSEALPAMLWQGFATGGQYLIPFVCLLGALASFLRRRKRKALFETASQASSVDALQGMSWQEFEMLVGEGFKRRGYGVREIGGGGADGGVDFVLTKGSERFFVQCKQWKAFKVGVSTARQLYGVMATEGAGGGFVVTSGRFTTDAEAFAVGRNIRLIDGTALLQLLKDGRASKARNTHASEPPRSGPQKAKGQETGMTNLNLALAPAERTTHPACPGARSP